MNIRANETRKKALIKKYWSMTRRVFIVCRAGVVSQAEHTDPDRLKTMVKTLLSNKPMLDNIVELWSNVGGEYAYQTEKKLKPKKYSSVSFETKDEKQSIWKARMKAYAAERSLQKINAIMNTEQEAINKVIDKVIEQSVNEGLGIAKTRSLMKEMLQGEELATIEGWQAERIAMTEVGGASNTGSFMAAQENSEGVKKEWIHIPGLKTSRDNHAEFEAMGPVEMDYEYAPGLKFPGDPDCNDPEEIINCYCSIGYVTED